MMFTCLEAEGGPMPDRGVMAVRLKICNSCYSRPDKSQLVIQLCAEILSTSYSPAAR